MPSSLRLSPHEIEPPVQGWACRVMGQASAAGLGLHCLPCTLALWLCSLELCHIFFFLFFVYFSFPKFHPSVLLSSLFLYLLYKGHHWIPWTRLLTRVHKFDFLCQLATVFSSVYQLTCMDLPNLLNPNKSQTEFIFPKSFLSSCLLLENFIIHQHVKYQNLLFFCSSSVQFGSVQSLSHV